MRSEYQPQRVPQTRFTRRSVRHSLAHLLHALDLITGLVAARQMCSDDRQTLARLVRLRRSATQLDANCTLVALRIVKRNEINLRRREARRTPEDRATVIIGVGTHLLANVATIRLALGDEGDAHLCNVRRICEAW
jgi:hypothetical protein